MVLVGTVMGQYGEVIGAGHFVALIAYLLLLLVGLLSHLVFPELFVNFIMANYLAIWSY